jgi:hypothetical protein
MIVFTNDWLKELKHKWDKRPRYEKPSHYFYATDSYYEHVRSEVEEWITLVPENQLNNVVQRLRLDKHFQDTYNELVVANILSKCINTIEYEKILTIGEKRLTPDWYVQKDKINFAVEVLTIKVPEESQKIQQRIGYFISRLHCLNHGVLLNVNFNWRTPPNQQQIKTIVKNLDNWLGGNLYKDQSTVIEAVEFIFQKRLPQQNPFLITNSYVYGGSTHGLGRKIEQKVAKYRNIEIPLVVAVVPTFYTSLDIEDACNVILGTEQWVLSDTSISPKRDNDGLYTRPIPVDNSLSTILWIPKKLGAPLHMPEVGIFPNPNAKLELLVDVFKSL